MKEYEELKKAYKEAMKDGIIKGIIWFRSPFSGLQRITVECEGLNDIVAEGENARKLLHYIEIF